MTIGIVLLLLAAYSLRVLIKGRYQTERLKNEPGSVFLGRFFLEFGYWCFDPMERSLLALGVTPNQLTAGSVLCSVGGAAAFATGRFTIGGWLVIACAVLDALDGMVARARGTASDAGESVGTLIANPAPGAPVPPILPPVDGFLMLDKAKFAESFAGDVPPEKAEFMANSQVPWGLDALNGPVSTPAWKTKPSWYLVVTEDKMIPPPAQQFMSRRAGSTVKEVGGSHAIYVSKPQAVADIIKEAATGSSKAEAQTS